MRVLFFVGEAVSKGQESEKGRKEPIDTGVKVLFISTCGDEKILWLHYSPFQSG